MSAWFSNSGDIEAVMMGIEDEPENTAQPGDSFVDKDGVEWFIDEHGDLCMSAS